MIIKLISEPLCNGTREAASKNEFTFADASPASAHSTTREKNCGMCTANFNYAFAILHCVYFVKSSNRQRLLIEKPFIQFHLIYGILGIWDRQCQPLVAILFYGLLRASLSLALPPVTHCHEPSNKLQLSNKRQPFISIEQFTTRTLEPDGNISLELNAITNRKKRGVYHLDGMIFFLCADWTCKMSEN